MPDIVPNRWTHPAVLLVATDLSDLDRLMPFALEQAEQTGVRLILLHVLGVGASIAVDAVGMPVYDPMSAMAFATKALKPCCEAARARNIACDALLREGDIAQQIELAIQQFNVDRLLLGTRHRSRLGKLLLGSVAEQVLRTVHLPVMTVGPEAHLTVNRGGRAPVVLHATTLRESSRASAALACQLASSLGARLVLLHVLPPMEGFEEGSPPGLELAAMHELKVLAKEHCVDCVAAVEPFVAYGNPSIEILAAASEHRANLIVLGSTHRSVFDNLTRDRVVYRVLANARCPVLTLREAAVEGAEMREERFAAHH